LGYIYIYIYIYISVWRIDEVTRNKDGMHYVSPFCDNCAVSDDQCRSSVADVIRSQVNLGWTMAMPGISRHLVQHLHSVMNAAARMIYSTSRFSRISPSMRQLHWLKNSFIYELTSS